MEYYQNVLFCPFDENNQQCVFFEIVISNSELSHTVTYRLVQKFCAFAYCCIKTIELFIEL